VQAVRFLDMAQKALSPPPGTVNIVGVSVESAAQSAPINVPDRQLAEFTDEEISVLLKQHGLETLATEQEARA